MDSVKEKARVETRSSTRASRGHERRRMARQDTYVLNEGTPNQIISRGRFYTLKPEHEIRTTPAETRDSSPIGTTEEEQLFFAVDGQDRVHNGVHWTWGFWLRKRGGQKAEFIDKGYIRTRDLRVQKRRK